MNQLVFANQTIVSGRTPLIAARGMPSFDLDVPAGAFVGLVGPSGSGKSALLRLLAGLDRPSAGHLTVGGVCLNELDESERQSFRANAVSIVFPSQNLLPTLTLQQNLELPLLLSPLRSSERRQRARSALEMVGLGPRGARYPRELPPVDQQRAAIARSLLNGANLILADEPCQLISPSDHGRVLDLLSQLNSVFRKTIVLATRDESVVARTSLLHRLSPGPMRTRSSLTEATQAELSRQPLIEAMSA